MLHRRSLFLVLGVPIAAILLCLLLGLSRSRPREQIEAAKGSEYQEVKIIAVEEKRPKPVIVKKVERKKPPAPQQARPKEPSKAPPPARYLEAKVKTAEAPVAGPKPAPPQEKSRPQDHAPVAAVKKTALPPATYRLDRQVIDEGLTLINNSDGLVPIVEASYESIGFEAYLHRMYDLGGQLFVGSPERRQILGSVVMESQGKGHPFQFFGLDTYMDGKLEGMALFRPREISHEPLVDQILSRSYQVFGEQNLRVVVLLPLPTEAGILGALTDYLSQQGHRVQDLDWVSGHYMEKSGSFSLKIEKGRLRRNQRVVNLDMVLEMN